MAKKSKHKFTSLNVKTWQDGKLIRDTNVSGPFPAVVKRAKSMARANPELEYQIESMSGKNCLNMRRKKVRKCRTNRGSFFHLFDVDLD